MDKFILDSTFVKQPKRIKVPLYKKANYICKHQNTFHFQLFKRYQKPESQFLITQSATVATVMALQEIIGSSIVLGIPSFFCPNFAYACLQKGYKLVFYDISLAEGLTENSCDFLIYHKCNVILIPNLFGKRDISHQIVSSLLSRHILVILDEAQSFPEVSNHIADSPFLLTLFSFGKSKPLAGIGGGGLLWHGGKLSHLLKKKYTKIFTTSETSKQFCNLEDLLLFKYNKISHDERKIITNYSNAKLSFVSSQWHKWNNKYNSRNDTWKKIQEIIPEHILDFLRDTKGLPSILALKVKNRKYISNILTEKGIQTTWYYYPLSNLPIYSNFPCENLTRTNQISQNILILPWSINHSDFESEYLIKNLESINEYFNAN